MKEENFIDDLIDLTEYAIKECYNIPLCECNNKSCWNCIDNIIEKYENEKKKIKAKINLNNFITYAITKCFSEETDECKYNICKICAKNMIKEYMEEKQNEII